MEDSSTAGSNNIGEPIVWPNESQEYAQYMRGAQNRCCDCKVVGQLCLTFEADLRVIYSMRQSNTKVLQINLIYEIECVMWRVHFNTFCRRNKAASNFS